MERGIANATDWNPNLQAVQNFARRDQLLAIQEQAQRRWESNKVFEVDAPATGKIHSILVH